MNEFAIEWIRGRDWAGVTAPSSSWLKNRILKLAERYPDEVKVLANNADGSIFAHVPVKYIKISPPRKISEEQRTAAAERLKRIREEKEYNDPEDDLLDGTESEWDEAEWEDTE